MAAWRVPRQIFSLSSGLVLLAASAAAQQFRFYSEFERFDPWGDPVSYDRDLYPREIISPSIPRNGHLSLRVLVTAPPGTNYFLYAASNPPGLLKLTLYRERFVPCGVSYCPDWLTEQPSPSFGAIPESLHEMKGQTTRSYLMDLYAQPGTPPGRVRVEAQLKTGTWSVAPLEVRVVEARVPWVPVDVVRNAALVNGPSSAVALWQLERYLAGLGPQIPGEVLRLSDIIQRNAAEDMLLAGRNSFSAELSMLAWSPLRWRKVGAEWYLKVRDRLHK